MSKFGNLGVEIDKPARMFIKPNEIDTLFDTEGNPAYIDFLPVNSEPGRKLDQKQQREQVRKLWQRNREAQRTELENADTIKDQAERLAALATGWHLVDYDGSVIDFKFSHANALELFSDQSMDWLRRRAWVWLNDETNFMPRSSKNSASSPSTNSGSTDQAEPAVPSATT